MTNMPNNSDLAWIATEAQAELSRAQVIETAAGAEARVDSLETIELGYYEAELRSLRDAATTLNEAEHPR